MIKEKIKHKIIPGTYDKVFKALMKSKECRSYLIEILGSITGLKKEVLEKGIVFLDTEFPVENVIVRRKITDLVVTIGNNVINLEMNPIYYSKLLNRNEIYYSRLKSLYGYNSHNEYNRVIQINFDNFDKYEKTISKFIILEEKTHEKETENYEKYHINLKKIKGKYYNKEKLTRLEKLLLLLVLEEESELREISEGDEVMEEVKDKIITLSQQDAMILCYDEEEYKEYVRQQVTEDEVKEGIEKGLKEGLQKGIEQGIEQGIKQGIEQGIEQGVKENSINVAKSLLEQKVDIDIIVKATGLSKKEIEKL